MGRARLREVVRRHRWLDPRFIGVHARSVLPRRVDPAALDERYARDPDPYAYEVAPYERERYGRMLEMLGDRRFERAFEMGCSIGVFTGLLASRCDSILAVDGSARAVGIARVRLGDEPIVRIEHAIVPAGLPAGDRYDLIVAADISMYLNRKGWRRAASWAAAHLEPGGILLGCYWRAYTAGHALAGDTAARITRGSGGWRVRDRWLGERHRIEVLEQPG